MDYSPPGSLSMALSWPEYGMGGLPNIHKHKFVFVLTVLCDTFVMSIPFQKGRCSYASVYFQHKML